VGALVEARFLGPFTVAVDGVTVELGGAKQRSVLAILLRAPGRRVGVEVLVDEVWGARAPGAVRSLRTHVSNLRRSLGGAVTITGSHGGYVAEAATMWTDVAEVESLVGAARSASSAAEAYETFRRAWAQWRGPVLDGLEGSWADAERATLGSLRRDCLIGLAEAAATVDRGPEVIAAVQEAVAADPYDERLAGVLMTVLYRSGRPADALAVYRSLERELGRELGVVPGPDVSALEEQILRHQLGDDRRGAPETSSFPAPLGDLVGREDEIIEALERLAGIRLLTITGPAGVGKTRFAVELARRLVGRYGDRRWMVDLSTLSDERAVDAVIAGTIRVQPRAGMNPLESVTDHLRTGAALLVLDNCEHLARAVAHAVASILRSCPDVTVIATSRSGLHVDGEVEWLLPPLAVPDTPGETDRRRRSALDLLLQRAPRSFQPTSDNAADLVSLCRSLDGLPLAIELAASRLGALTPADIVGELHPRLDVLTRPGGPARQSTLFGAIEWSVGLVTPDAAALLSRLGVMAGWFSADDAAAVASDSNERIGTLLTELAAQSLVVTDTSGSTTRYRLLETIRQFAVDGLGDELATVRAAHVARFAGVAEREGRRLRGEAEAAAVDELARAHDNLRAAMEWSVDHGEVDSIARIVGSLADWGYFRARYELAEWAERSIALADAAHPRWFALCGAAARGAWVLSRFDDALRFARQAGDGDEPTVARSGHPGDVQADVALYRGDADAARDHYLRHRQLALDGDDSIRESWTTYYLSVVAAVTRRWDEAAEWAREVLVPARASGNPTALAYALYANGLASKHRDPDDAVALFDEAIRVADSVRNEWFGGIARMERASTRASHGDVAAALPEFADVIDRWSRAGDLTQLRLTWRYLVPALVAVERHEDAAVLAGALLAERGSTMSHPSPRTQDRLADALGRPRYDRLVVRGSVLQVWELVRLSLAAIAAARGEDHPDVPLTSI
jgi:predicted ATPase/DNA-binding SARP family transcriptional activator